MALVIFDFDGTIYRGETLRLFLRVIAEDPAKRSRLRRFYASYTPGYILYKLGIACQTMIRTATKGLARILTGMTCQELQKLYLDVFDKAQLDFCPVVLARLEKHLTAGDRVILLSGALDGFVAFVASRLGVTESIGSRLAVENNVSTGKMSSILIADEKVNAVKALLGDEFKSDIKNTVAYADGIRDLPLLALVGVPVAAHPEPKLARIAEEKGWEIIF